MRSIRFKFCGQTFWLFATLVLFAIEILFAGSRGRTTATPLISNRPTSQETTVLVGEATDNSILVVGNSGSVYDDDLEITIVATPVSCDSEAPAAGPTGRRAESDSARDNRHVITKCRQPPDLPTESVPQPSRVYFLETSIAVSNPGATGICCRLSAENSRIRIYVDERALLDASVHSLVAAIDRASLELAGVLDNLVGPVRDIDGDGHLAVVVTPEVARLGNGTTPVDGLTRPVDFRQGIDRPAGNCSDVVFLSTSISSSDHLRAVLAHEWCHAAIFGRQGILDNSPCPSAGDDWLNEALAHVVEVRASGSATNVSHRIRRFLQNPGSSPLVVRDYCQPGYWRHDGCRGAAYLFLSWCLQQSDDGLLGRLVNLDTVALEGLESATGKPFESLFREWTLSLGQRLADRIRTGRAASEPQSLEDEPVPLNYHVWKLMAGHSQTMHLRIRGTCAEFIVLDTPEARGWQVTLAQPRDHQIKATATLIVTPSDSEH